MFDFITAALKDHPVKLYLKTGEVLLVEKIVGYITNDNNETTALKIRCTDGKQRTILSDSIDHWNL
ncbi:hypothetical protein FI615_001676 [Enterococcus faecium]|nr:hypothetical protein [Enterococcus faecium]EHK9936740.1 hypothetical protein [Enterococcus faecium]MBL3708339.1 hypothetical protein [Enterococcus faecium]